MGDFISTSKLIERLSKLSKEQTEIVFSGRDTSEISENYHWGKKDAIDSIIDLIEEMSYEEDI